VSSLQVKNGQKSNVLNGSAILKHMTGLYTTENALQTSVRLNYDKQWHNLPQWCTSRGRLTLQYIRKASFTNWSRSSWFRKVSSGFLVNIVETIHNN